MSRYPYFSETDRRCGFTKGVTRSQFARLLVQMGIQVSTPDLHLIAAKYENPVTGHINYPAFVAAVDDGESVFLFFPPPYAISFYYQKVSSTYLALHSDETSPGNQAIP